MVWPPRDQGDCSTCWAFSAVSAMEGHYALATGSLKRFSEQELADCAYAGQFSHHDSCKKGGYHLIAFRWLQAHGHLSSGAEYPYTAQDGECRYRHMHNTFTHARVLRVVEPLWVDDDSHLLGAAAAGPVSVTIQTHKEYDFYSGGVLSVKDPACGAGPPEHALVVVGYKPKYWLVRNSYGPKWGEKGYVKWSRKIPNMCGISLHVSYPEIKWSNAS